MKIVYLYELQKMETKLQSDKKVQIILIVIIWKLYLIINLKIINPSYNLKKKYRDWLSFEDY